MSISESLLKEILSKPAYEPENIDPNLRTPKKAKIKRTTELRAKDINKLVDDERITPSPFKESRCSPYGKGPLSQRVIEHKKTNDITVGRNAAMTIFYSPVTQTYKYTIDNTCDLPGSDHAELKSLDKVPDHVKKDPDNIKILYSERKPCCKGPNCHCKLKTVLGPNTQVVWSVDHPNDKNERVQIEAEFKKAQAELGIRDPKVTKKRKK